MVQDTVDKVAIRSETGVVPVFDVVALNLVPPLIGAFAAPTRLIVASICEKLVPDASVLGYPHADVWMVLQFM